MNLNKLLYEDCLVVIKKPIVFKFTLLKIV